MLRRPTSPLAILPFFLVASTFFACGGAENGAGPQKPGPADPGRPCTMIGCYNGFTASLDTKGPLPPGHYTVDVEADGVRGSYEVDIPLPPCDTRGKYTGELKFGVGESGCALPPDQHTLSEVHLETLPKEVKIRIVRTGTVLADVAFTPAYRESRPNGPDCEPVCNSASEKITVTSR